MHKWFYKATNLLEQTEGNLKKVIGVFGLSSNIVNIIVGSGIFVLPAIVAGGLGASSVFAYLFCGVLIALVMLCFAAASNQVTESGGAYTYIKTAFGPYFGFLTAILFILATISADAAVANAIVNIVGSLIPSFQLLWVKMLTFLILFTSFGYINIRGVKNGVRVVKFITVTKLIPLLLLILWSWGEVSAVNLTITEWPSFAKVAEISLVLFFAFQGAESGLSISGEVKQPKRNIPKGIIISITIVLTLYILIQTVSQGVLGDALVNFKENPLGAVANQVFGPVGFTIMTFAAAVSMIGYLSSSILSMPRILFRASADKVLPISYLTKIHPKFNTPYIAIMCYATLGFIFASIGGFKQLAIIASATVLLIYLGVSLAIIKLSKRNMKSKDGFQLPGGHLIPIVSSLIILYLLSNLALEKIIIISVIIFILTIIYFTKKYFEKGK